MKKIVSGMIVIAMGVFILGCPAAGSDDPADDDPDAGDSGELISNGSFTTGIGGWTFTKTDATDAALSTADGTAKITVVAEDATTSEDVILTYAGLSKLVQGHKYRLTFRAWTEREDGRDAEVRASFGNAAKPQNYQSFYFVLRDAPKTYTCYFYLSEPADPDMRLTLRLSPWTTDGVFHLDDVSLLRVSTDPPAAGTNLITNGDFSDWDDYWSRWRNNAAGCTWITAWDAGMYAFDITNGGTIPTDMHFQSVQPFSLLSGKTYTVSFRAMAEADGRSLGVHVTEAYHDTNGDENYETEYGEETFVLTAEWQTYTFSFTMPQVTEHDPHLQFLFGGSNLDIAFDDVTLVEATP